VERRCICGRGNRQDRRAHFSYYGGPLQHRWRDGQVVCAVSIARQPIELWVECSYSALATRGLPGLCPRWRDCGRLSHLDTVRAERPRDRHRKTRTAFAFSCNLPLPRAVFGHSERQNTARVGTMGSRGSTILKSSAQVTAGQQPSGASQQSSGARHQPSTNVPRAPEHRQSLLRFAVARRLQPSGSRGRPNSRSVETFALRRSANRPSVCRVSKSWTSCCEYTRPRRPRSFLPVTSASRVTQQRQFQARRSLRRVAPDAKIR